MKINLGAGTKALPGWVNVDIRPLPGIDVVSDLRTLPFKDEAADLVYACHVLEHFGRHEYMDVLKEWHRILKPGGKIRLAMPDFKKCVMWYSEHCQDGDLTEVLGLMMGGQKYPYDFHKMIFDFRSLEKALQDTGFRDVGYYDWRDTIHKDYDDFSQAYRPHLDRVNGVLMSLNVEAIKI